MTDPAGERPRPQLPGPQDQRVVAAAHWRGYGPRGRGGPYGLPTQASRFRRFCTTGQVIHMAPKRSETPWGWNCGRDYGII